MRLVATLAILAGILNSGTYAKLIERSDYKITVPDACTIDPEDPDIDLDHMTTINLPNKNTMLVMVLDDEKALDKAFNRMKDSYKGKVKGAQEKASTLAAKRNGKGVIVSGLLNGMKFCFEVVAFPGAHKGFIVISTYLESEEIEARKIIQKAVDSFSITE